MITDIVTVLIEGITEVEAERIANLYDCTITVGVGNTSGTLLILRPKSTPNICEHCGDDFPCQCLQHLEAELWEPTGPDGNSNKRLKQPNGGQNTRKRSKT